MFDKFNNMTDSKHVDSSKYRLQVEHFLTIEVPGKYVGVALPLQYFGQTLNISRTGLGVKMPRLPTTIRPGIEVSLLIQPKALNAVGGEEGQIVLAARVIWCTQQKFGLRILDLAPQDRALYESLFPEITPAEVAHKLASPPQFNGKRYVPRVGESTTGEIDLAQLKAAASPASDDRTSPQTETSSKTRLSAGYSSMREISFPKVAEKALELEPTSTTPQTRRARKAA